MISATEGFINQSERYSSNNAGKSLKKYTLLKKGELAYNHGYSKTRNFGSCFTLEIEQARIPFVYHSFSLKGENDSVFWGKYLNSGLFDGKLRRLVASTARMDGLLNISFENYSSMPVNIPSLPEQKKIAAFFTLLDRRIQKQRQLVECLKTYKRGYFRYLLSTFTTKEYLLNDIIFEYTEKATSNRQYPILSSTMNGIKLQTTYFNKYAASENTIGYKIVPYGYFTYRSMSDTGEFHFNYQDIIDKGIVSPAYPVFCVSEFHNSRFVEYILNETDFIKSQLMIAKEGGTRYALSFPKFQRLRIQLPDKFIQDKVAEQIVLFERKISSEEKVLLSFEVQKKHLLQQMFI